MLISVIPLDNHGYYRAEIFKAEVDGEVQYCVGFGTRGYLYDGVVDGFITPEDARSYAVDVAAKEYEIDDGNL